MCRTDVGDGVDLPCQCCPGSLLVLAASTWVLASHGGAGFLVAVGALRSKSAKVLSKMEAPKCLNPNQKHIHWPREGPQQEGQRPHESTCKAISPTFEKPGGTARGRTAFLDKSNDNAHIRRSAWRFQGSTKETPRSPGIFATLFQQIGFRGCGLILDIVFAECDQH